MEGKNGFISIVSLIVMSIVLTMSLYLVNISKMEHLIINAGNNKSRSYYQAENKIYLSLYDDKYYINQLYLKLIYIFRNNRFGIESNRVILDDDDLELEDNIKDVWFKFIDEDKRIKMNLTTSSIVNGIKSKLTSSGTVVSDLFEIDKAILSLNSIEDKYRSEFKKIIKVINEDINIDKCYKDSEMFGIELRDYNKYILSKSYSNNYEITSTKNIDKYHIKGFNQSEVFIIARQSGNVEFYIGDPEKMDGNIKLSGIIYIEGDLIISSDFDFNGIIIVKDGQIINESMKKCKIEGLLIMENIINYDEFVQKNDIIRSRHLIYKYGTYLPGFLDPKIDIIKGI